MQSELFKLCRDGIKQKYVRRNWNATVNTSSTEGSTQGEDLEEVENSFHDAGSLTKWYEVNGREVCSCY